jgi:hypothetical protein
MENVDLEKRVSEIGEEAINLILKLSNGCNILSSLAIRKMFLACVGAMLDTSDSTGTLYVAEAMKSMGEALDKCAKERIRFEKAMMGHAKKAMDAIQETVDKQEKKEAVVH